ncbi:dephospho-CoA kinase [Novispirillum sp. DQ9]|uniref:dephospho-CoA kinase n=1 Tax=Novispirillum sp. DQ9 TaxID=3398612 RepID=UPI003C79F4E3
MIVLGVTGSIAMGKSTACALLRAQGVPVHDADATVHALFDRGGLAVPAIAAAFPGVVVDGCVDRTLLGPCVLGQPEALKRLEGIVHPLVRAEEKRFLDLHRRAGRDIVALDIPLLFETGGEGRCDATLVVSAPAFLQRQRALRRPGMTPQKLAAILARQMPDAQKRRRADYIVPSGLGRAVTWRALARILAAVRQKGL